MFTQDNVCMRTCGRAHFDDLPFIVHQSILLGRLCFPVFTGRLCFPVFTGRLWVHRVHVPTYCVSYCTSALLVWIPYLPTYSTCM